LKKNEIKRLREPWEGSLISALNEVNELFSNYMKELGCAGEVRISKGNADTDESRGSRSRTADDFLGNFKDWGIQIRVKFREKSDLQTLSAHVHSGGERSVSTIMYLMALQDKMVSPFRCVDEINQGLDERNERLVFRRIVQNSTKPPIQSNDPTSHTGQYFLITPKLLPNLTDMENDNVTVLCIFK
jgi:chromosome segregation ATPase